MGYHGINASDLAAGLIQTVYTVEPAVQQVAVQPDAPVAEVLPMEKSDGMDSYEDAWASLRSGLARGREARGITDSQQAQESQQAFYFLLLLMLGQQQNQPMNPWQSLLGQGNAYPLIPQQNTNRLNLNELLLGMLHGQNRFVIPQHNYLENIPPVEKTGNAAHDITASALAASGGDLEQAKLVAAQAWLESGGGKSGLTTKYNNYFGTKGTGPAGTAVMPTEEVYGGRRVRENAGFRVYHSPEESFADHQRFLAQNPRYRSVLAADTFEEKAIEIQRSGYATDPAYARKLINIYNSKLRPYFETMIANGEYSRKLG